MSALKANIFSVFLMFSLTEMQVHYVAGKCKHVPHLLCVTLSQKCHNLMWSFGHTNAIQTLRIFTDPNCCQQTDDVILLGLLTGNTVTQWGFTSHYIMCTANAIILLKHKLYKLWSECKFFFCFFLLDFLENLMLFWKRVEKFLLLY